MNLQAVQVDRDSLDFQYIEDSNFRFIPDVFLGWEGNFLLEAAVTFYRNKPQYLHLSFGWPH